MKKWGFFILVCLSIMAASCQSINNPRLNQQQINQTAIAETMAIPNAISTMFAQTENAIPTITQTVGITLTATPITPTPTTPTITPTPLAIAHTEKNLNCRLGPDKAFTQVGTLSAGESAAIIARSNKSAEWMKVRLSDGTECWVFNDAISSTGNIDLLPTEKSQPTPTPRPPFNWAGPWTLYISESTDKPDSGEEIIQTVIKQTGDNLYFTYSGFNGMSFVSSGTVSPDGTTFNGQEGGTGNWTSTLYFVADPAYPDQFRGKWYVLGETRLDGTFCGSRNGAPRPNPCRP